jgi:hypothetical protein
LARSKIPDPLTRRHLVVKNLAPAQALAIAEPYLADDRRVEAIDSLKKAEADDKLGVLRELAMSEGDVFLLRAVADARRKRVPKEDWERIAENASARGLERYADEARRQADRGEE